MISRRAFAVLAIGVAASGLGAGQAQQNPGRASGGRAFRIGALSSERSKKPLLQAPRDAGYDGDDKLIVEFRPIE